MSAQANNEEELSAEDGEHSMVLLDKIEGIFSKGAQSQKTLEKLSLRKRWITRRMLVLERVCKINTQACCQYFLNRKHSAGDALLRQIIDFCVRGAGGVQESGFQTLCLLVARDPTMDVGIGDRGHMQINDPVFLRFFYANYIHLLTDCFVAHDDHVPLDGQLHVLELLTNFVSTHPSNIQFFLNDGVVMKSILAYLPLDTPLASSSILRAGRCVAAA